MEKRRDRMKCIRVNTFAFLKKHEPNAPEKHQWHYFLYTGLPPIRKRIKNGKELFSRYNMVHRSMFQNLEDCFDLKFSADGYITHFANPIKWV